MKKSSVLPIAKKSLSLMLASSVVFAMVACSGTKAKPKGGAEPTAAATNAGDKQGKTEGDKTNGDTTNGGKDQVKERKLTAEAQAKLLSGWIDGGLKSLAALDSKVPTEKSKKVIAPVVEQLKQLQQLAKDGKSQEEDFKSKLTAMSSAIVEVRNLAISLTRVKEAREISLEVRIWAKYYLNKQLISGVETATKFDFAKITGLATDLDKLVFELISENVKDEAAQKEFIQTIESARNLLEIVSSRSTDEEIKKILETVLFQLESNNKALVAILAKPELKEKATQLQTTYLGLNLLAGRDAKFSFGEVKGATPAVEKTADAAAGKTGTAPTETQQTAK